MDIKHHAVYGVPITSQQKVQKKIYSNAIFKHKLLGPKKAQATLKSAHSSWLRQKWRYFK